MSFAANRKFFKEVGNYEHARQHKKLFVADVKQSQ